MEVNKTIAPGLFAQDHNNSNRDYSREKYWGKNPVQQFVSRLFGSVYEL